VIQNEVDYRISNIYDHIDGNDITINEDAEKSSSSRKACFCVPLLKNKCFVLPSILFLLVLGMLIVVLIKGNTHINNLKNNLQIRESFISERENQTNQMIKERDRLLWEKSAKIEQINRKLIERNKERSTVFIIIGNEPNSLLLLDTILIKAGRKFGGDGGNDFDDSFLPNFTSSHYVSGILFSDIVDFNACQFIYKSSRDNQSRIVSIVHGNGGKKINSTYIYNLTADERIKHVQVRSFYKTFYSSNAYVVDTRKVITGLKFITTNNRTIPPNFNIIRNDVESEEFLGYTLGYVTGKSDEQIDQLQFFWYRT
jgi:hypothetical protein